MVLRCVKLKLTDWALLTVIGLMSPLLAGADTEQSIRWHGFLSQGLIATDDNNFLGDSESISTALTEVGIGASWNATSRIHFSAQALYLKAGDSAPDGIELDFGLVDINLINDATHGLGLRAGRLKNPYGFYNETRDVMATRASILLPESIYPDTLREIYHSSDSIGLHGYKEIGSTLFQFDVISGRPLIGDDTLDDMALFAPGTQSKNNELWVGRLMAEYDGGRLRGGISRVNLTGDLKPGPVNPLFPLFDGELELDMTLFSLEYNQLRWQLTAEYQVFDARIKDYYFPGFSSENTGESWYLQARYEFMPRWYLLARYDVYYGNKDDKDGKDRVASGNPPSYAAFAKDTTFSLRYEVNEHWVLSTELHHVSGIGWLRSQDNADYANLEKNWNMLLFQVGYHF